MPVTDPAHEALFEALRVRRATEPLVGARLGAEEISQGLLQALSDGRGVHGESLLAVVGGLAGQAAQASLRACALAEGRPEMADFQVVRTTDGDTFLIGEPLTRVLAGGEFSLWSLAAAAALQQGCQALPDPAELFGHAIDTLGSEAFGVARVPTQHQPSPAALQSLPALWPAVLPTVRRFCADPAEWPVLFALLAQQTITLTKDVIDPCLALVLVMETATAQAKVPLPRTERG
jgi:hypothetical protein